jgi:hypothetical protein
MLVSEAKTSGLIPYEFRDIFPDFCNCGAPHTIDEARTHFRCSSETCGLRLGARGSEVLKKFGLDGMGVKYVEAMMLENRFTSILDIFIAQPNQHPNRNNMSIKLDNYNKIQQARQKRYTYKRLVEYMCYPGVGDKAAKLFKGINNFAEFADALKSMAWGDDLVEKLYYFCAMRLGVGENSKNMHSVLFKNIEDLARLDTIFPNRSEDAVRVIPICITGDVFKAGPYSQDGFVDFVNQLGEGKVGVHNCKAYNTVKWVISDSGEDSRSYREGEARKILTTSDAFVDWIKEEIKNYEDQ